MDMINNSELEDMLSSLELGLDGIYSYDFNNIEQEDEIKARIAVSDEVYDDYKYHYKQDCNLNNENLSTAPRGDLRSEYI